MGPHDDAIKFSRPGKTSKVTNLPPGTSYRDPGMLEKRANGASAGDQRELFKSRSCFVYFFKRLLSTPRRSFPFRATGVCELTTTRYNLLSNVYLSEVSLVPRCGWGYRRSLTSLCAHVTDLHEVFGGIHDCMLGKVSPGSKLP